MRRALGFLFPLLPVLALLAWGASSLIEVTSRRWFERDTEMRGRLAITVARETTARHWVAQDKDGLARSLVDLTRDERILSALACDLEMRRVARTPGFPYGIECTSVGVQVGAAPGLMPHEWHDVRESGRGRIHVGAFPLVESDRPLGFVVLVHDMSFVLRRDAATARAFRACA